MTGRGADSVSELPSNWENTTLGEITSNPQYGWTTKSTNQGVLHLLRTTDITSGIIQWDNVPYCDKIPDQISKYIVHDGDILISRAGSVGFSILVKSPKSAVFASYLIRFIPYINAKYVSYFLNSPNYWKSISENKLGIAVPNVNATKLSNIKFPLPPLPEQHRIVAKIEELFTRLDAGVAALTNAKTLLKQYRQAVLKAAVEGRLTEEWRKEHAGEIEPASVLLERIQAERKQRLGKNYKPPKPIDTSNLLELPEGWAWARVTSIGEVVTGTTPSKKRPEYYGNDYPFYKPTDLNCGYYVHKSADSLSVDGIKRARSLPANTILVTCIGATIGKTGLIRRAGASNQQINAILNESAIIPEYLFFTIISPFFQNGILSKASSTTLPILNKSKFEELPIMIPSTDEQLAIVSEIERMFSIIDESEQIIDAELQRAQSLRQSILKRAFAGKLVPQDPADEPASVLLERIRKEKKI